MKKRLLITSIVMMLVVAVALSTATYAWFTSNASVTANSISLTAGTSNAPSLSIAWTGGQFVTELTDINAPSTLMPVAPAGLNKTSGSESLASQNYYSGTIRTENSVDTFNDSFVSWSEASESANAATPYYLSTGTGDSLVDTITLKNGSTVINMSAVNVKADITGDAAKLVRIAFYKKDGATTNYKLVDVLGYTYSYTAAVEDAYSSTETYYEKDSHNHYRVKAIADASAYAEALSNLYTRDTDTTAATATHGVITADKVVSTMETYTTSNLFSLGTLAPEATMELKVVIWLDGLALNDETQGFTGSINLTFTAVSAA